MSVAKHQACFTTKLQGQNLATFSHFAVMPIAYLQHTVNTNKTCVNYLLKKLTPKRTWLKNYSLNSSIQNASKFNFACFSFSVLSLAALTSSSSSFKVNCPWHGSNSTNGFLMQLYWSTDISGKYLLRVFNRPSVVILATFLLSCWPPAEPLPGA